MLGGRLQERKHRLEAQTNIEEALPTSNLVDDCVADGIAGRVIAPVISGHAGRIPAKRAKTVSS